MSRTRAERRHNTEVKTSARASSRRCTGLIGANGEAHSCSLCESEKRYSSWTARPTIDELRHAEWLRISLTDYE